MQGQKLVFCSQKPRPGKWLFSARAQAAGDREHPFLNYVESMPVARGEISGEFYGIDLASVQSYLSAVTPVPCCPAHIRKHESKG